MCVFVFFVGHSLLDLAQSNPRSRFIGVKLQHPNVGIFSLPFKWPDADDVTWNVFFFKIWLKDSFALLNPTFFFGWPWGERGAKGVEKEVRKEQKAKLKVTWMKAGDTLFINIYPESNCRKSKTIMKIFQPSVSISYSKNGYCKRQRFVQPQLIWQRERHISP